MIEHEGSEANNTSKDSDSDYIEGTKALTKLEQLDCFGTVKNMLENGVSVPEVAKFIRETAKESLDISEKATKTRLYRYIQKNSKDYVRTQIPRPHLSLYQQSAEKVELHSGLDLLLTLHLDRIVMEYEMEKKIGKAISSNTASIKVAAELLKTKHLIECAEGIRTEPTQHTWDDFILRARERYSNEWGKDMANVVFNPDSRRRIIVALEKVKRGSSADFLAIVKRKRESLGIKDTSEHSP